MKPDYQYDTEIKVGKNLFTNSKILKADYEPFWWGRDEAVPGTDRGITPLPRSWNGILKNLNIIDYNVNANEAFRKLQKYIDEDDEVCDTIRLIIKLNNGLIVNIKI
tara:strand:- start:37 stop:357 length:321 start_codon:yes stop_codon:yes gene_type:complete